jgi:MFS family permease
MKTTIDQTFAALKHRNFRLFWIGQCISLIGTWMQNIAQSWLVLELTNSPLLLGTVNVIQFTPMMLLSLFAGTMIDRFSKQKMIIFTQTMMLLLALVLAIDITVHTVALWHIFVLAAFLGIINTLDMPTRQAFIVELVGKQDLRNAIVLNSTIFNAARIIGPSVAGFIIAHLGMNLCFFLNAASFIPVIIGLSFIRLSKPDHISEKPQYQGIFPEIIAGLVYVRKSPVILIPILLMAFINVFTLNFNVLVPIYAKNVFHGDARTYGLLMTANGIGAFIGSFILAARSGEKPQARLLAVAAFGICILELLLVPVNIYFLAFPILVMIGFSVIAYATTTNSLIQFQAPDHLRGRIMSLYTFVFMGLTPIGSFLSGWAAEHWGAPITLGLGALIGLITASLLIASFPKVFRTTLDL